MSNPSEVEGIKARSNFLRGTLKESVADSHTGAIRTDDTTIIKFHGSYQQDDRDLRAERAEQKLEPLYRFMLRVRMPAGVATPAQWLKMDELSRTVGNQTMKLTTRQAFQLHGVLKRNLKATIQGISSVALDTVAACGDINRNVILSANPEQSDAWQQVYPHVQAVATHLLPKSRAYHEIWLDGELVDGGEPTIAEAKVQEDEPIYGPTYLPRKFKTAFVVPPVNDVDVLAHDLGFIAIFDHGKLAGFNVSVGGGLGSTHGDKTTYPRLADVIGFVTPEQLLSVAEHVLTVQRDHGERSVRKHARLKYTIEKHGVAWFVRELEARTGFALAAARDYRLEHNGDRFGWIEGSDGRWHLTLHIDGGRIQDTDDQRLLSGLREIAKIHGGDFRLTPNQNLVIANVPARQRSRIDALVAEYGLGQYAHVSPLRRDALACVSLPTCSLAMAEAERYLPAFVGKVEALLQQHGLLSFPLSLRITGCPNGCARPWLAEIGMIGKAPGRYNLYLGGDAAGTRFNQLHRENIDEATILATLDPLIARFAMERSVTERFGDWLHRAEVLTPVAA